MKEKMEKVETAIKKLGDAIGSVSKHFGKPKEVSIEHVLFIKQTLIECSEVFTATQLFIDSEEKVEKYKRNFTDTPQKNVEECYVQLLQKAVAAPTSIHLRAVAILNVPVLVDLIKVYENDTERKNTNRN